MSGFIAKPRAIRTFCWFPPDSEVILSPRSPILMDSRSTSQEKTPSRSFQLMIPSFPPKEWPR